MSRSRTRARGWGIPVPDDPHQVIYVWWDALGNYLTALGYGDQNGGEAEAYRRWWRGAGRRVHVIGKNILRFHAVFWPAILLSAGEPLPTDILVHDFLTANGRRLSKSSGNVVDPVALTERYGSDALRWWLLREVQRVGETGFTVARLTARSDKDLAGGFGNLVNRVVALVHRYRDGRVPIATVPDALPTAGRLLRACRHVPVRVDEALAVGDFRRATGAVWAIVAEANRFVETVRPWELARAEHTEPGDASWTPPSRSWSAPAGHSPPSCRRSCPPPPARSPPSATTRPATCLALARSFPGSGRASGTRCRRPRPSHAAARRPTGPRRSAWRGRGGRSCSSPRRDAVRRGLDRDRKRRQPIGDDRHREHADRMSDRPRSRAHRPPPAQQRRRRR